MLQIRRTQLFNVCPAFCSGSAGVFFYDRSSIQRLPGVCWRLPTFGRRLIRRIHER